LTKDGNPLDTKAMAIQIRQLLMSLVKMAAANRRLVEFMKPTDLTTHVISQGGSVGSALQTPLGAV
jgi:hypothetical protein